LITNDLVNALRMIALRAVCGVSLSTTQLSNITTELRMEFRDAVEEALLDLDRVGFLNARESQFNLPQFPHDDLFPNLDKRIDRLPEVPPVSPFVWPSTVIVKKTVNGELEWLPRIKGLKVAVMDKSVQEVSSQGRRVFVFFVDGVTLSEVGQFIKFGRGEF
jgi:hypothetical protein